MNATISAFHIPSECGCDDRVLNLQRCAQWWNAIAAQEYKELNKFRISFTFHLLSLSKHECLHWNHTLAHWSECTICAFVTSSVHLISCFRLSTFCFLHCSFRCFQIFSSKRACVVLLLLVCVRFLHCYNDGCHNGEATAPLPELLKWLFSLMQSASASNEQCSWSKAKNDMTSAHVVSWGERVSRQTTLLRAIQPPLLPHQNRSSCIGFPACMIAMIIDSVLAGI